MRLLLLLFSLFLVSCAHLNSGTPADYSNSWPEPPLRAELYPAQPNFQALAENIYSLNAQQEMQFLEKFNSRAYRKLLPNKRISKYLKENLADFNFYSDTLSAREAIEQKHGNCLTLAIVTKTLADLVNVAVSYELVATQPIYRKTGDFVLISQHVRTLLYNSPPSEKNDSQYVWSGYIRIDYFPSNGTHRLRGVAPIEFYSMYFNNKAAEALTKDQDQLAYWYLRHSLSLNKIDPQTINMLALIHDRAGFVENAEELYLYGLKHGGDNFELLSNYRRLLDIQNRKAEASYLSSRLKKYKDPNPYKWVDLGNKEIEQKNYATAIYYFKKANKIANYLHEGYAGIARAQFSRGNYRSAQKAMKKAIEKSNSQDFVDRYQAEYNLFATLSDES